MRGFRRRGDARQNVLDVALNNGNAVLHKPLVLMNAGGIVAGAPFEPHGRGARTPIRSVHGALDAERIAIGARPRYAAPHSNGMVVSTRTWQSASRCCSRWPATASRTSSVARVPRADLGNPWPRPDRCAADHGVAGADPSLNCGRRLLSRTPLPVYRARRRGRPGRPGCRTGRHYRESLHAR